MKIAAVDVFAYDLTYVGGRYVMSGGRVIDRLSSTVVRVRTEDGIEGFGEVCPLGPAYLAGPRRRSPRRARRARARGARAEREQPRAGTRRPRPGPRRPRLREERHRHRVLGRARPLGRAPPLRASRRPPAGAVPALRRDLARPRGRDGGAGRRAAGGGHPPLPAEAGRRPGRRRGAHQGRGRGDRSRGHRRRRRQRRLAGPGRGGRGAGARAAAARLPRAALPDARGVPPGQTAHDDADGPRRVDPGCRRPPARVWREGHGGVQPQALEGGRAQRGAADAGSRGAPRDQRHDRGHLGRRPRHRGGGAPRREHAAGAPLHRFVHERLDERARRRPRAALERRLRRGPVRPRARGGRRRRGARLRRYCSFS